MRRYDDPVEVRKGADEDPDQFLEWARSRYRRVYFLGGGGTELLSRYWNAASVASHRFQVPEYESSATYPRGVRRKEFDFGLYELLPRPPDEAPRTLDLDVGIDDARRLGTHPMTLRSTLSSQSGTAGPP